MASAYPPCTPVRIAIVADDHGGDFTGMSHAGTWLFLRNRGTRACALPALPRIRFLDRRGRTLRATREPARAPAVTVMIDAGTRVRAGLRWVSGKVFDHSHCLAATRVAVTLGGRTATVPLRAQLCGARLPVGFEQQPLTPIADYPAE